MSSLPTVYALFPITLRLSLVFTSEPDKPARKSGQSLGYATTTSQTNRAPLSRTRGGRNYLPDWDRRLALAQNDCLRRMSTQRLQVPVSSSADTPSARTVCFSLAFTRICVFPLLRAKH